MYANVLDYLQNVQITECVLSMHFSFFKSSFIFLCNLIRGFLCEEYQYIVYHFYYSPVLALGFCENYYKRNLILWRFRVLSLLTSLWKLSQCYLPTMSVSLLLFLTYIQTSVYPKGNLDIYISLRKYLIINYF